MKKLTQLETYRKALEAIPRPLSNYRGGAPGCGACGFIPRGPGEEHYADCWWVGIKKALSAQGEQGTDTGCQHEFVSDYGLQPACTKCGKVKDLLGCPFCGEIPDFESDVQEVGSYYAVECPGCNAQGPIAEYPDTACDVWDARSKIETEKHESAPTPTAQKPPTETQERCPKCKTEVEWVFPPIPGAKPFFQCQDGDCNWMSDDDFPVTESKEGRGE